MDELTVKIVSGASENLQVRVDLSSTSVLSLKKLIEQQDAHRFPASAQRLIFQGQILQDDKLLTEYNVTAGCALHLTLAPVTNTRPSPPSQLRTYLQQMKDHEAHEAYATAVRTLHKICVNIVDHPTEEKFRKLRGDNAALKAKLFDRTRGQDCVQLLGFQSGIEAGHLVLTPSPEKWENLVACKAVVDSVVAALGGAAPTGTMPLMGGNFAAQAQNLFQNPSMLQSLSSNPMVQQLSQQNPLLAQALQNPALLAQSMQALQQNPAMMQQINQMMSDPNPMARMQQMMAGNGMGMGLGEMGGSLSGGAVRSAAANPFAPDSRTSNPFASSPTPTSSTPPAPGPASTHFSASIASVSAPAVDASTSSSGVATSVDSSHEAFDEDAIAQAIARSLQDE